MAVFDEQYVMSNLSPNNQRPFRDPLELPDVANTLDMDDELKADSYTGGLNVNRGILQSLTDKGKEAFGFLKNKGAAIGGGIASAITGIPFLGTAFNAMQRPEYPSDAMSKSFAYGNENSGGDLGYYDALRHGNLNGQDQFGINTVSALGKYPAYYSQYVKDYGDGKYSITSKFGYEKYMHGKNVINKNRERIEKNFFVNDDNDGNDNITYTPPSNNQNGGGGGGGGGAPPGFGSTAQGNYTNQFEGGDPGQGSGNMSADDFSDDTEGTPFAKGGRARYFFGGRVNYKAGGRTNYVRGGAAQDMGNAENQKASATAGGGATGDFSTGEQTMNHNIAMRNAAKQTTPVKNIIDAGSELNYLNNLKNLNLPGIALGFGVNKFRDFISNKKTKEEEDKLSALPNNNYFAEVQKKDLDASKMKGFKQQDYPSYKDQMDMFGGTKVTPYEFKGLQDGTITTTGTFTAANGGRAMFKNGGLASIL